MPGEMTGLLESEFNPTAEDGDGLPASSLPRLLIWVNGYSCKGKIGLFLLIKVEGNASINRN